MRKRSKFGIAAVACGASGLAAFLSVVRSDAQTLFPYQDEAEVISGAAIYELNCAACHGTELEGQPDWQLRDADGYLPAPPLDGSGHTWHHPDRQLLQIVTLGVEAIAGGSYRSRMAGFGDDLSQEEILAALAYVKSRWPQEVIDAHNRINAR